MWQQRFCGVESQRGVFHDSAAQSFCLRQCCVVELWWHGAKPQWQVEFWTERWLGGWVLTDNCEKAHTGCPQDLDVMS